MHEELAVNNHAPESEVKILSMGWGVQSWAMAAMFAKGALSDPRPEFILHADTTWEHQHTYDATWNAKWLTDHGFDYRCVADIEAAAEIETKPGVTHAPLYTVSHKTGSYGQLRRSCTHRWKIVPQRREIRRIMKSRGIKAKPGAVTQYIGISLDEWTRMKTSDVKYIKLRFPLVDAKISKRDCIEWLEANGLPVFPSSSCVFCPYHSHYKWYLLKKAGGKDWEEAVRMDRLIRHKRPGYDCYFSDKRKPLEELTFDAFEGDFLFDMTNYPCDSGHCFL